MATPLGALRASRTRVSRRTIVPRPDETATCHDALRSSAGAARAKAQRAEELAKQAELAKYFDNLDEDELELEVGSQDEI